MITQNVEVTCIRQHKHTNLLKTYLLVGTFRNELFYVTGPRSQMFLSFLPSLNCRFRELSPLLKFAEISGNRWQHVAFPRKYYAVGMSCSSGGICAESPKIKRMSRSAILRYNPDAKSHVRYIFFEQNRGFRLGLMFWHRLIHCKMNKLTALFSHSVATFGYGFP